MERPPTVVLLSLLHSISPVSFTVGESNTRVLLIFRCRMVCTGANSQPGVSSANQINVGMDPIISNAEQYIPSMYIS